MRQEFCDFVEFDFGFATYFSGVTCLCSIVVLIFLDVLLASSVSYYMSVKLFV